MWICGCSSFAKLNLKLGFFYSTSHPVCFPNPFPSQSATLKCMHSNTRMTNFFNIVKPYTAVHLIKLFDLEQLTQKWVTLPLRSKLAWTAAIWNPPPIKSVQTFLLSIQREGTLCSHYGMTPGEWQMPMSQEDYGFFALFIASFPQKDCTWCNTFIYFYLKTFTIRLIYIMYQEQKLEDAYTQYSTARRLDRSL